MVQLFSVVNGKLGVGILVVAQVLLTGGVQRCTGQTEPLTPASITNVEAGEVPRDLLPSPAGDSAVDSATRDNQSHSPEPPTPELLGAGEPAEPLDQSSFQSEEPAALPQQLADASGSSVMEDDPFADLFLDLPPGPSNAALASDALASDALASDPLASDPLASDQLASDAVERPLSPDDLERVMSIDPAAEQVPRPPQASPVFAALPSERGYAVLVAAPVHEALISRCDVPVHATPVVSVVSPPPPALNEQPPLPSRDVPLFVGNEVQWIGGYWAWLADAEKYVWISGLYRDVPPGRQWQPGQWTRTSEGYRWDSGYWSEAKPTLARAASQGVQHASAPPLAQDPAPRPAAPHPDSFWIPGVWLFDDGTSDQLTSVGPTAASLADGFRWQKGFWAPRSAQWIWQPAHYVRAADEFVFVSGYWDYEPHYRGQAYAAVDFSDSSTAAEASYRPAYPLCRPISALLHLFFKSDSRTVFYGDLYDDSYAALGYRPWYVAEESGSSSGLTTVSGDLSPLLSFYNWKYQAQGIDFVGSMIRFERHFRSTPSIRPTAQLATTPRLIDREGLAGAVYANSFDAIVRGVVAGQPVVNLADVQSVIVTNRSAAKPVVTVNDVPNLGNAVFDSAAVITAAAAQQPIKALTPPEDAVPLGLPGTSGLMVLPGGKIISAPPAVSLAPLVAPPVGDAGPSRPNADLDLLFGRP